MPLINNGLYRRHGNYLWSERIRSSIPWLKKQEGLIDYYPGKPLSDDENDFSMVSIWEDIESLKSAIGKDWQKAILFEDETELVEETSVEHYEVFSRWRTLFR